MKAIIVDDSRSMRMMLKKLLTGAGFDTFVEAGHGQEALDKLREGGAVDLALVDWNMPVMTGIDLVRAVRKEHAYDAMTVMMVTTESGMSQMQEALEAGANEFMMKPFTPEALREKLQILGLVPSDA